MVSPTDNVAPEHVFHFQDGKEAHNLKDLRDVMGDLSDEVLAEHLDDENNDFANWIEFVYKNKELAEDVRKLSDVKQMIEVIDAELGKYGGEKLHDQAVPQKKSIFSDPGKYSHVPQTIKVPGEGDYHTVSTEDHHKFIVKEMIWGFILGFIVGMVLILALLHFQLIGFI